ncbi:MAG: response regulator [Bacilli bacterium]
MKDVNLLIENGTNVKKALELFGDMETYDETLSTFLSEVPEKLQKIKNYKEVGDMANYAILVHSLKSDARYFGFEKLAEVAYEHELKSKANDMFFVTEHYDELMTEANRVVNLVKKYMGVGTVSEDDYKKPISHDKAILVVDDSNLIRNFILKIFKDDFEVIVANDGKEALDILNDNEKNGNIKAMLLDLNMPNVNGFEVLDYFKRNDLFKKYPTSIITGVDDKESIEKAYKYPIIDILLKPFNERDVKKILEKTLNNIL